jgi:hypothetical protein
MALILGTTSKLVSLTQQCFENTMLQCRTGLRDPDHVVISFAKVWLLPAGCGIRRAGPEAMAGTTGAYRDNRRLEEDMNA